eukprot:TRINITY_DN39782_c0_g1_i1.p1 TRINITY_DN39782_c0_g1~~TRINITY_DN39782_c0_g1_i1.p1  ORF type:complete len:1057 (-),score=281.06 TRINITY_DN39782_c0_g1_i1:120-3290(-)
MAAAVSATSIDDLFRQKPLSEIHSILKQTRHEVEAKKQELRELVGDHYRSVLESSDHIRAMSHCAAKVSAGAERVEELIASMRHLAANPPASGQAAGRRGTPGARPSKEAASHEQDHEFRVGQRVMALLEVPETVRGHLGAYEFLLAARVALLDAAALQGEVAELLRQQQERELKEDAASKSADGNGNLVKKPAAPRFDFAALMRQQAATFRSLPRQVVASCVDAFSAPSLEPPSAAQSFVVHLLLEPSLQPVPLLRLFLERRVELLRGLLDCRSGGSDAATSGAAEKGSSSSGTRLAAAAMAFEGTVVLSSALCQAEPGAAPKLLRAALDSVLEGAPDTSALEERAAIEGRSLDEGDGPVAFKRRVDSLGALLRQGASSASAMTTELSRLGGGVADEWMPSEAATSSRSLSARFSRLLATAPAGSLHSCEALGTALSHCSEKVVAYRHVLAGQSSIAWPSVWESACRRFCPERSTLGDALAAVQTSVEAACAEVVRERVNDLQLDLVPEDESEGFGGSSASSRPSQQQDGEPSEEKRQAEIQEAMRQSQLRVARFDEQLGEILADLGHIARGGLVPSRVTAGLLTALGQRVEDVCNKVKPPDVKPLWPVDASSSSQSSSSAAAASWSMQRSAARAAIALDALLGLALQGQGGTTSASGGGASSSCSQLQTCLHTALSSGDASLVDKAQRIVSRLKRSSAEAFLAWARLAMLPDASSATSLQSFWRLANDEVGPACGWGSAKFAKMASPDSGEVKAIPVPVQASAFVMERVTLGARRALEVSGSNGVTSPALVTALKMAVGEALMAAYDASKAMQPAADSKPATGGICHHLQWLFDLQFVRISLSDTPLTAGANDVAAGKSTPSYEALTQLLDRTEAVALADAVDRTLYQPVLKSAVKSHVQGVRMLLAPFFLHNPLYGFHFNSGAGDAAMGSTSESDGFEIQATFAPPLRPTLPRFPLLPVATASALANVSSADLQARLGAQASAASAAGRGLPGGSPGAGGVSALTQQVGSAFEAFGASGLNLTKAGQGLLGWGGSNFGAMMGGRPGGAKPEAV